ncbi:MAG: SDR family NAD(P)-dependent oxidoreductase [Spongiibacteraceae bacterium]|jgi:NAD(P)-dependent dehydrogenase (short-subunit alcohol dehydrogenase family)|nr:SDR family NAD(P)-dependent oxidoreductase [Spongiibacteraceae bacterium]
MKELRDKVAVITGGASGIGRSLAARLQQEGMTVVIADFDRDQLARTSDELGVLGVPTDVSRYEEVEQLAATVKARYGAVHLICNNAGVGIYAGFERLSLDDIRWMMDVNFWGVVHGTRAFLPLLRENADGGHIMNTASMNSLYVLPGGTAYGASKFAVLGFTETLAAELALEGAPIGVTAFCPGPTRTAIAESPGKRPRSYGTLPVLDETDVASRAFQSLNLDSYIAPEPVVEMAVEAIRENRFWVISHPDLMEPYTERHQAVMAAIGRA